MFRTLLCTVALTALALTAADAEAGKFKFSFGGGNHGNHSNHNHHNHKHHNWHHNHYHHNHYQHKVYHAPVVKCYYQVCFYCDAWNYKKHEVFTSLYAAQAFAHQLQHNGYYTSISKTCTPYASGHIIYNKVHNPWLP